MNPCLTAVSSILFIGPPMTKLCCVLNVSDGENDLHTRKAAANIAYWIHSGGSQIKDGVSGWECSMHEWDVHTRSWSQHLKKRDRLEDLSIEDRKTYKDIIHMEKEGVEDIMEIIREVLWTECGEFLQWLRNYHLLNDSDPSSQLLSPFTVN